MRPEYASVDNRRHIPTKALISVGWARASNSLSLFKQSLKTPLFMRNITEIFTDVIIPCISRRRSASLRTQADSEPCPDPALCQLDCPPLTPTAFPRLVKCQKDEWHLPWDCSQNSREPPGAQPLMRARPWSASRATQMQTHPRDSVPAPDPHKHRFPLKWAPEMSLCCCPWMHQSFCASLKNLLGLM